MKKIRDILLAAFSVLGIVVLLSAATQEEKSPKQDEAMDRATVVL